MRLLIERHNRWTFELTCFGSKSTSDHQRCTQVPGSPILTLPNLPYGSELKLNWYSPNSQREQGRIQSTLARQNSKKRMWLSRRLRGMVPSTYTESKHQAQVSELPAIPLSELEEQNSPMELDGHMWTSTNRSPPREPAHTMSRTHMPSTQGYDHVRSGHRSQHHDTQATPPWPSHQYQSSREDSSRNQYRHQRDSDYPFVPGPALSERSPVPDYGRSSFRQPLMTADMPPEPTENSRLVLSTYTPNSISPISDHWSAHDSECQTYVPYQSANHISASSPTAEPLAGHSFLRNGVETTHGDTDHAKPLFMDSSYQRWEASDVSDPPAMLPTPPRIDFTGSGSNVNHGINGNATEHSFDSHDATLYLAGSQHQPVYQTWHTSQGVPATSGQHHFAISSNILCGTGDEAWCQWPPRYGASVGRIHGDVTPSRQRTSYEIMRRHAIIDTSSSPTESASPTDTSHRPALALQQESPESPTLSCDLCSSTFSGTYRRGNLNRHVKHIHSSSADQNTPDKVCRVCNFAFKRNDAKKKHEWKQHRLLDAKPEKRKWRRGEGIQDTSFPMCAELGA